MLEKITNPKLSLKPGQKVFVTGQNGSGKSVGAYYLLAHAQHQNIIALDTKGEEILACLPDSVIVNGLGNFQPELIKRAQDRGIRNFVVRPLVNEMDPVLLDDFLLMLYESCSHVCIYVDESYSIKRGGPGFNALLTRGRSKGLTVIYGSQRPVWVSQFFLSESNYLMVYKLLLPADRERIYEVTGYEPVLTERVDSHQFYWFDLGKGSADRFAPVPLPSNYSKRKILSKRNYRLI